MCHVLRSASMRFPPTTLSTAAIGVAQIPASWSDHSKNRPDVVNVHSGSSWPKPLEHFHGTPFPLTCGWWGNGIVRAPGERSRDEEMV